MSICVNLKSNDNFGSRFFFKGEVFEPWQSTVKRQAGRYALPFIIPATSLRKEAISNYSILDKGNN
jgi:hypothetical protein